jgi:hypothetical protein
MNSPQIYLVSLLIIVATISFMAAAAQEGNKIISNNNCLNNAYLNNLSNSTLNNTPLKAGGLDLAIENRTLLSQANNVTINIKKDIFIVGNATAIDPLNRIEFNASENDSETKPPNVAAFIIDGFARPTRNATYKVQSSLNAAYLSRIVEGTPHGYATYYN